jgi:hypothetical protein
VKRHNPSLAFPLRSPPPRPEGGSPTNAPFSSAAPAAIIAFSIPRLARRSIMVERRKELNQRYARKKKMTKLKARLAAAKDAKERETVLKKIKHLSPWWVEPRPQQA